MTGKAIACLFVVLTSLLLDARARAGLDPPIEESVFDGTRFSTPEPVAILIPTSWRTIGKDGRSTTALCPRLLDTPYCALETLFACRMDGGAACYAAIVESELADRFAGDWIEDFILRYRIVGVRRIGAGELYILRVGENPILGVHIGDIIFYVEEMRCAITNDPIMPLSCDGEVVSEERYVLQFTEGAWRILTWSDKRGIP